MKRFFATFLCMMLSPLLISCGVDFHPGDCPYGVWECENPKFTMDINPEADIAHLDDQTDTFYSGTFSLNEEPIEIKIYIFDTTNSIRIFYLDEETDISEVTKGSGITLIGASYKAVDGKLRLQLDLSSEKEYGVSELYLNLIKEYDVPEET